MDLLTGYDATRMRSTSEGFGTCGMLAVAAIDRARSSKRPRRSVFFDERMRIGSIRGGRSGGGGSYQAGLFGEEVVADGLERAGWRLLGHRVKTRVGELDLVARRGDTIVFAEVKTAGPGRLAVEESVSARQRMRCRRAAVAWMANNPRVQRGVRHYRFDAFFVRRDADGAIVKIDHVRDAF